MLYEPPLPVDGPIVGGILALLRRAIGSGRIEDALTIGLKTLLSVGDDRLAALRAAPLWTELLALTPGAVRELETIDSLEAGTERFAGVSAATLLLAGTRTARHHSRAIIALGQSLPAARTVWLEEQGHQAHVDSPAAVARVIIDFFEST